MNGRLWKILKISFHVRWVQNGNAVKANPAIRPELSVASGRRRRKSLHITRYLTHDGFRRRLPEHSLDGLVGG
jgi:hypothetical protein